MDAIKKLTVKSYLLCIDEYLGRRKKNVLASSSLGECRTVLHYCDNACFADLFFSPEEKYANIV